MVKDDLEQWEGWRLNRQRRPSTTSPGFLDLVDLLGRGGTEEWRELYRRAHADPALREEIRAGLPLVDAEVGAGRELWTFLLDRLERRSERQIMRDPDIASRVQRP